MVPPEGLQLAAGGGGEAFAALEEDERCGRAEGEGEGEREGGEKGGAAASAGPFPTAEGFEAVPVERLFTHSL